MGFHRKNCAREDEPRRGGKGAKDAPGAQGASSPEAGPLDDEAVRDVRQSLPRLDDEGVEGEAPSSPRVSGASPDPVVSGAPGALPPLGEIGPEHVAYVRALVSKLAVSPTYEREDLVQEVLIQAHRSKHSSLEARALLFGITRHVVYRWIASHQQEQAALASHDHPTADDEGHPSAEDEWQAAERRNVVRASIDELPEIFRDVFVRVEVEEMSMPEAAKDLGIPINTGYTRLHLARARFSELLRRLLARRRIDKEDLVLPVLLAGSSGGDEAARIQAPRSPGTSWLPHLPWGSTELLLLGGAVAVSLAVRPPEAPPADVVAEPQIASTQAPTSTETPSSAETPSSTEALSSSEAPFITGTETPPSERPAPRDSQPAPSTSSVPPASSGRASPAAPSSPSTIRSDGAWARDIAKLALAGDRAGAAAELGAFRKAYPNSTYITRLEAMVLSTPPRPAPSTSASAAPAAPPSPNDDTPR